MFSNAVNYHLIYYGKGGLFGMTIIIFNNLFRE